MIEMMQRTRASTVSYCVLPANTVTVSATVKSKETFRAEQVEAASHHALILLAAPLMAPSPTDRKPAQRQREDPRQPRRRAVRGRLGNQKDQKSNEWFGV